MLPPFLWPVRGTSAVAAVDAARQAERQADKNELDRLLYVALTRARDRLYIAGFEGTREAPADCWYHLIRQALEGRSGTKRGGRKPQRLAARKRPDGCPASEWRSSSAQAPARCKRRPGWPSEPPAEADAGVPLRPSQLAPLEDSAAGAQAKRPPRGRASVLSPHALLEEGRFLRGNLTHALLEHLPDGRPRAAGRRPRRPLLANRAPDLDIKIRSQIIAETLAVLEHPELAPLFGPDSRAEVPIVATLPSRNGAGLPAADGQDRSSGAHRHRRLDRRLQDQPPAAARRGGGCRVLPAATGRLRLAR